MNAVLQAHARDVHPDEWKARVELAAAYRIFDMLGWTEMIYNHITVRVPDSVTGGKKHFLINPFGLHYSEVTASNLLKIDVQGGAHHRQRVLVLLRAHRRDAILGHDEPEPVVLGKLAP